MSNGSHHLEPLLLSAYLDGELSDAEREQVETHLPDCSACRQELEALRGTVALLQRLPEVRPPRTFFITEAMVTPEQTVPWWRALLQLWQPLAAGASAAVALFLVALLVFAPGASGVAEPAPVAESAIAVEQVRPFEAAEEPASAGAAEADAVERAIPLATETPDAPPPAADAEPAAEPEAEIAADAPAAAEAEEEAAVQEMAVEDAAAPDEGVEEEAALEMAPATEPTLIPLGTADAAESGSEAPLPDPTAALTPEPPPSSEPEIAVVTEATDDSAGGVGASEAPLREGTVVSRNPGATLVLALFLLALSAVLFRRWRQQRAP